MKNNILQIKTRQQFRQWLIKNHSKQDECWLAIKKGKPTDNNHFWYIDAVEEAICFGWIDGVYGIYKNKHLQRFSPRSKKSDWTELNKERVRRLEKLGLMTDAGRRVLPAMGPRSFKFDEDLVKALKCARVWTKFKRFPSLYQRVRAYNTSYYKDKDKLTYKKALDNLIKNTNQNKMYGQWNDWGRLVNY